MMTVADVNTSLVERDKVLWKEMKEGNKFAFREIFELYSNLVFQYGLSLTKDRELVKDCVQELFIILWTQREHLGMARSIKYYLFFSLRRLLLKNRNYSKKIISLSLFNGENVSDPQELPMLQKEQKNKNEGLLSGEIDKLPCRQREAIFLKFYQQLDNEEITQIMNLNSQVVRNTLCKALKNLRKQMVKRQMLIDTFYMLFGIGYCLAGIFL
jgi:RNA polymerase sigma-70 factor (ECF subfamily)